MRSLMLECQGELSRRFLIFSANSMPPLTIAAVRKLFNPALGLSRSGEADIWAEALSITRLGGNRWLNGRNTSIVRVECPTVKINGHRRA